MYFRSSTLFAVATAILPLLGMLNAEETSTNQPVDFAREILPLLSDKCFVCHGPDSKKEDLLRLDSFSGATKDLGGYQAIDPENPEQSRILVRIHDSKDPMPPEDSDKPLSDEERILMGRWIHQGGNYAKHWAFVPPVKKKPADSKMALGSEIDSYVLAKLNQAGIPWAPEADRTTLARRVALILTGLPPDPEQLSRYLEDEREDAYERLVDELLANPRFGEHQARYWLDAVRYGDTHGLHLDNRRGIYPYRDWVVKAFNNNLPLDDFITWQLAGDLLPNPTLEQRVATGFVRMNPTTSEGGAIPAEFQAKNNFDRVENLGTVLLGMTLNCTRCHTHKYDPIQQTEYYRLMAFFNNTAEYSMDGNAYVYGPVIRAPENQADWNQWTALETERETLLSQAGEEIERRLTEMQLHAEPTTHWSSENWKISKTVSMESPIPPEKDWDKAGDLPGIRRGNLPGGEKAVWLSFDVSVPVDQVLWLTYSGGPDSLVFINEIQMPLPHERVEDQRITSVELAFSEGSHQIQVKMAGTMTLTAVEARLDNAWQTMASEGMWEACTSKERLLMLADARGPLGHVVFQNPAHDLVDRITRKISTFTTSLVAKDRSTPRTTQLLRRGEYNLPTGDPLQPGILKVMGAFPKGAPRNRLGLARWLTSREHPLVSRVLINRIWQRTFGEGLVRSSENFGLQGTQPTHPGLIDWLAVELQDSHWDLKHMLRLMVTSRTFRQQSNWRQDINDPPNLLLARGPSYRLDAEVLRDLSLWASGQLDPHMGGEGVKPYQPSGMWLAMAHPGSNTKRYVKDEGRRLYRRSLYVYWKRTSPHPMMSLFDAPSRETSCVRRSRTNTSLQSLGLFNETQRLEMSRLLAERLIREQPNDEERLNLLFGLLAGRNPTDNEKTACEGLLDKLRKRYATAEEDALALLSYGDTLRNTKLNPVEHAAWSQVAITVLASDVAILLY